MADGFNGGIEAAQRQLQAVEKAIIQAMPQAVEAGAVILQREAEALAPRLSGQLAGSAGNEPVESDSIGATHRVYFNAFHARFNEFGTSKMSPQPFLRPAAELSQQQIETAMAEIINEAAGDAILATRVVTSSK